MQPSTFIKASTQSLCSILVLSACATAASGHVHSQKHASRHSFKRDVAVSGSIPSNWSSLGCYTDNVNSRALYQSGTTSQSMTEASCISFCSASGFPYAGVEYGNECYCGNRLAASSTAAPATDCNMGCAGAISEACGSASRLNVFHLNSDVASKTPPAHNAGPPSWGYLGCYVDSLGARTLPGNGASAGGYSVLTNALCTQACQDQGYLYAGTEYSGECYCGTTLDSKLLAPDGLAGCNMACNGNSTEYCGGANRLDVFGYGQKSTIVPKWSPVGCYTDTVQTRTLRYAVPVLGGGANMTQGNCQDACYAGGYRLSGIEYAQECWCDNSYQGSGGPAPDGNAGCNMACKGDASTICGGPNRLTAFQFVGGSSSSSSTATPTIASSSAGVATATSTSAVTISTGLPGNFTYRGCYMDNAYGRILTQQSDSSSLTVQSCITTCQGLGNNIAAMEYSTQCFCGNSIVNGGVLTQQDSDCSMPCGGNTSQFCGAGDRMSVYAAGNFSSYAAPKAYNTSLPGNWTYKGCLTDIPQPRVLPYQLDLGVNLTVPNCLNLCHQYGYSASSMEYGEQCFCGDDTDRVNAGVTFLPENQCNTPCPGQPEALCGGASAMTYYTWDNVNVWHQATGNAAGKYEFLIGGVVIPLLTQVGINGKVTFVEKHGTGPPNSTGSYELDLSQVDNFSQAWRTIDGLKTDVFCSAGLMLPDKAGRIINIGGWSGDSTYGIRLYAPDGSSGIAGVNGWQENVDEVALQRGRWYPGALQLVNGSILVVGGEDGSNGVPVPSLEVIPRPSNGPVLYMDWLDRTDPNNLYPFLTVLPTGNIAVFYYNEARILDENTFQTVRTLPNMPGAVNRPDGGRTYPLEGTSMLLPQHAPYTDPLEVLICGGSTPYQGFALDNCISIQPEVPGANWTIERMPDKRVISCMTALPDGTYLILNGAHQGVAGFGLASDPNHMAVLYDPSLPRMQRMTRMANTTIDRLYHSEAILLLDGRVLVSGSDPEDNGAHAQEYRVEVFIPPYLMGNLGASRPSYTIVNNHTDWAYGESIDIIITSGSVSKISLMASVSSTHGNSMGQRTIFPAFTCSGQRCTIVAPPNGHITGGPGWHMLFVVNAAGTPSVAQWVRIGGDPAGLGNWPNYSDFTLPGV